MKNPSKPTTLLKIGEASKILGVSIDTLRRWEKAGKIKAIRTPGGTRLYSLESLKKVNPASVETYHSSSLSTEELLKRTDDSVILSSSSVILNASEGSLDSRSLDRKLRLFQNESGDSSANRLRMTMINKFLLGSAFCLILTLLITSWITASYLTNPKDAGQFFKNNVASGILSPFHFLAGETVAIIDPKKADELGFSRPEPPPLVRAIHESPLQSNTFSNVLAVTSTTPFLEVNANTQINGSLFVRDSINGLSLEATSSANTMAFTSGNTQLTVTKSAKLDQDVSTEAAPTFTTLNLSATKDQLVFQSGGPTGTLTWTPTTARIITLPDVTTTLVGIDNTQTLTNKSMSGSSNTFTNIPNSALTNNKITVTAGTNLTGGGDINLGSSATIGLKDSVSLSGTLTVSGASVLSSTLAVTGATTLSSTLAVSGTTTLSGAATLSSTLAVTGATTLSSSLTVAGNVGIGFTGATASAPGLGLAVQGSMGIGTTSPNNKLQVIGAGVFGGDYGAFSAPANGLLVQGNVGIGSTGDVNYNLDVWGTARITGALTVGGNITPNGQYLAINGSAAAPGYAFVNSTSTGLWSPSANALSLTTNGSGTSGLTITANGNVGIGVTNPVGALQVNGAAAIGYGSIPASSLPTNGLAVSGNVGIGTTSPANHLHILSPDAAASIKLESTDTNGYPYIWLTNAGDPGWAFIINGADAGAIDNSLAIRHGTTPAITLQTGGSVGLGGANSTTSPALWAGSNGNVGIGFTSPNALLHIGGANQTTAAYGIQMGGDITLYRSATNTLKTDNNLVVGGTITSSGTQFLASNGSASAPSYSFTNLTNSGLWTNGDGLLLTTGGSNTSGITITAAGLVGIGNTSPAAAFQVNSGASSTVITSSGNIGIGSSSPVAKLQVIGTSQFNGASTYYGNLLMGADNTYDIGSAATRVGNVYAYNVTADNIAGVITGGSTTSSDWLINSGNTSDSANSSLSFKRGSPTNAVLQWYGNNNTFDFNSGIRIGINNGAASTIESTTGLVLSGFGNDITTGANENLSIIPNGTGNVGIGTSSPLSLLSVAGNAHIGSLQQGISAPTDGLFVDGNVGIGATTSSNKLDVWGNSRLAGTLAVDGAATLSSTLGVTGALTLSANNAALSFTGSTPSLTSGTSVFGLFAGGNVGIGTTGNLYGGLTVRGAGTGTNIALQTYGSGLGQGLTVLDNGNVGIGTTNPAQKFDVNNFFVVDTANSRVGIGTSVPQTALGITQEGARNGLEVSGPGNNAADITTVSNAWTYNRLFSFGSDSSNVLDFMKAEGTRNAPTAMSTETTMGYIIGQGYNNGGWQQSVSINLQRDGALGATNVPGLISFNTASATVAKTERMRIDSSGYVSLAADTDTYWSHPAADTLAWTTGGLERLRLDSSGNIGIGTTGPGSLFAVSGNTTIGFGATTSIAGPSNGLGILGNVGIGTTTANYNLSVVGTTNITGNLSFGSQLLAVNGSASLPSYSFSNLTNAGLWTNGDGLLLTTGGSNTSGLTVTGAGNIGIGITNPTGVFQVGSSAATPVLFASSLTGNIGIGTTGPSGILDVGPGSKDIKFFSNVASGQNPSVYVYGDFVDTHEPYYGRMFVDTGARFIIDTQYEGALRKSSDILRWSSAGISILKNGGTGAFFAYEGGNVGIGTISPGSALTVIGNIGIGTSAAGAALQVNGGGLFGWGTALVAGPANGLAVSGNVGVGTTSPLGQLHVVGQCVAKGTRIRRRRRGKNGEWIEEDVPVEDIKPDDEVLSLNDQTGKWEWHRVEKTMDMGIQQVYKLETESGKWIETTKEHPYLVMAPKTALSSGLIASVDGKPTIAPHTVLLEIYHKTNSLSTHSTSSNNTCLRGPDGNRTRTHCVRHSRSTINLPAQNTEALPLSQIKIGWVKVSHLKAGMHIATTGGWEKIISIQKTDRKQTYDLQIEGTHNFVGNDIVAHNTYINGNLGIGSYSGLTVPSNGLAVSGNVGIGTTTSNSTLSVAGSAHIGSLYQGISAPTNGLFVDGNVGIGATTSSNKLDVWGNARIAGTLTVDSTLTNSSVFRAANGSASAPAYSFTNLTNAGLWTNGDGLLLTTGGSNTSGITVTGAGNVGIGTTAPNALFAVGATSQFQVNSSGVLFIGTIDTNVSSNSDNRLIMGNENARVRMQMSVASGDAAHGPTFNFNRYQGSFASPTVLSVGDELGRLLFSGYTDGLKPSAAISAESDTGWSSSGNDAPGRLLFFTTPDGSATLAERMRITTTGNVGIGFTSPAALLHIGGANQTTAAYGIQMGSDITLYRSANNTLKTDNNLVVGGTITSSGTQFLASNGSASLPSYSFTNLTNAGLWTNGDGLLLTTGGSNTSGITVTGAGNVGIGTTNPSVKLEVAGIGRFTDTYGFSIGGDTGQYRIQAGSSEGNAFGFYSSGNGYAPINALSASFGSYAGTAAPSNGMIISGNVGIGFTSPNALFTVGASNQFQVNSSGAIAAVTGITTSGGYTQTGSSANTFSGANTFSANNAALSFTGSTPSLTSGSSVFGLFAGGNVGIGTTGNLYGGLTVRGAGTGTNITLQTYGAGLGQGLTVLDNGNVGIGTTGPGALFEAAKTSDGAITEVARLSNNGNGTGTGAALTFYDQNIQDGIIKTLYTDAWTLNLGTDTTYPNTMTLKNGNVGIGTTNPSYTLDINGPSLRLYQAGGNPSAYVTADADKQATIYLGSTATALYRAPSTTNLTIYAGSADVATFTGTAIQALKTVEAGSNIKMTNGTSNTIFFGTTGAAAPGDASAGEKIQLYGTSGTISSTDYALGIESSNMWFNTAGGYKWYVNSVAKNVMDSNGNVGIGTTSPLSLLSVAGNTHIGGLFQGISAPANGLFVDGNVGIGATTSSNKLDVWGNSRLAGTLTVDSTSTFGGNLTLSGNLLPSADDTYDLGSNTARWQDIYLGPGSIHLGTSTSDEYVMTYDTTNNRLGFNVNGSGLAEIVMDSSGNVGIGTTAPTNGKLEIYSNEFALNSSTGGAISIYDTPGGKTAGRIGVDNVVGALTLFGNTGIILTATGNDSIRFYQGTTERMRIDSDTGNVGIGTVSPGSALTVIGNIGIGTSAAGAALQVNGGGLFGWGTALVAGPANGLAISGNVGVGTTSPAGALHVVGQCVTGDTLLKRRRRKKKNTSGVGSDSPDVDDWEWEDVRIDEIKPGDEILSMAPDGTFEWRKVNALKEMGLQSTYKLITNKGKQIRTTGNHPYFILEKRPVEELKKLYAAFEVDQSNRLEDMSKDSVVSLVSREPDYDVSVAIKISKKTKLAIRRRFYGNRPKYFGPEMLAIAVIYATWTTGLKVGKIVIDKEYNNYEKYLSKFFYRYYPEMSIRFQSIGHSSAAHQVAWGALKRQKALRKSALAKSGANLDFNESLAAELLHSGMPTGDSQPTRLLLSGVYQTPLSLSMSMSEAKWIPAHAIRKGMLVATVDGWEVITSIYETKVREQTFDIEVEGTHNFVGNDIVAHNTIIMNGNLGIGTASPVSKFHLVGSGTTTGVQLMTQNSTQTNFGLAVLDNGNVGIGTTAPGNLLDIQGGDGNTDPGGSNNFVMQLTNTNQTANNLLGIAFKDAAGATAYTASLGTRFTDHTNNYGDLFFVTRGADGLLERVTINQNGNVGIGFTSPNSLLHIGGANNTTAAYGIQMGSDITLYRSASNTLKTDNNLVVGGTLTTAGLTNSSTFLAPNGSAAAPSYSFTNLTNAGLWTNGDGLLLTTGGSNTSGITVTGAGNVGIGTTSPAAGLSVSTNALIGYGSNTAGPASGLAVAGRVGIGTTSPGFPLDIQVNTDGSNFLVVSNNSNGTSARSAIAISNTNNVSGGAYGYLEHLGSGFTSDGLRIANRTLINGSDTQGLAIVASNASSPIIFATGGTAASNERMRIDSTGNVGIGFTSPNALFTVGASNQFQVNSSGAIAAVTGITTSGGYTQTGSSANTFSGANTFSANNAALSFSGSTPSITSGSSVFGLFAGGNVGIGTTGNLYGGLTVRGAGTGTNIALQTYGSGLGQGLTVLDNGNVGIGTTGPGAKLDIVGASYDSGGLHVRDTATPYFALHRNANVGALSGLGLIDFTGNITGAETIFGRIDGATNQVSTDNGVLRFFTRQSTSLNEVMEINGTDIGLGGNITTLSGFTGASMVIKSGNVGIGTTGPGEALEVNGDIQLQNNTYLYGKNTAGSQTLLIGTDANNLTKLSTSNHAYFGNYLGVNATLTGVPASPLVVNGGVSIGAGYYTVAAPTNGAIIQGNVGIGVTSPEAKIDIIGATQGTVTTLGSEVPGLILEQRLTSDADGNNGPMLDFRVSNGTNTWTTAAITSLAQSSYAGQLAFFTQPGGETNPSGRRDKGASLVEAMRIDKNGNLGIGTASPLAQLDVRNTNSSTGLHTYIGSSIGQFSILDNGNVGIGTTEPLRKLHVSAGDILVDENYSLRGGINGNNGYTMVTVNGADMLLGDTNASWNNITFAPGSAEKMRIQSGGNVGIGAASPGAMLHVTGNAMIGYANNTTPASLANGLAVSGNVGIGTTVPGAKLHISPTLGAGVADLQLGDYAVENAIVNLPNSVTFNIDSTNQYEDDRSFVIAKNRNSWTGGTALVTVKESGNVGIGTASPVGKLHLIGAGITTGVQFLTQNSTQTNFGLAVLDNGNVGIGTTGPQTSLHVTKTNPFSGLTSNTAALTDATLTLESTTAQAANVGPVLGFGGLYNASDKTLFSAIRGAKENATSGQNGGYLGFYTTQNGVEMAERMRIDSTGNVGIGFTSPAATLDVVGTSLLRGTNGVYGLTVTNAGSVGIGLTNPTTKLDILGSLSAGAGNNTIAATSVKSFAFGDGNTVTGGANPAFAFGQSNTVTGAVSFASGQGNNVSSNYATALGYYNTVSGDYASLALGRWLTASGDDSTVIGSGVDNSNHLVNSVANSFAVGYNSTIPTFFVGPSSGAGTVGNVGIGTTNPGSNLAVSGNAVFGFGGATSIAGPSNGLGISGNLGIGTTTANNKLQVIGAGVFGSDWGQYSAPANGLLVQGNIGIGATTSNNKLDVWGNANITGTLTTGAQTINGNLLPGADNLYALGSTSMRWSSLHVGPGSVVVHNDATNTNWSKLDFSGSMAQLITDAATPLQLVVGTNNLGVYLNANGNVGIGTTDATKRLTVFDADGAQSLQLLSDQGDAYYFRISNQGNMTLSRDSGSGVNMVLQTIGSYAAGAGNILLQPAGNVGIGNTAPGSYLQVNGNAVFGFGGATSIAGPSNGLAVSGNVGIGTTTANYNLSVVGTSNVTGAATFGSTLGVTGALTLSANNAALTFTGSTPSITSGSSVFGLFAGGNVGIGTTGNLYGGLTVRGAGTGTNIALQTYGSGLGQGLTVLDNGNVGIGTTAPSALFSVGATSQFQVSSAGTVKLSNGNYIDIQGTDGNGLFLNTNAYNNAMISVGGGADRRNLIFGEISYFNSDYDHASQTNPTLFIHSATDPDTDNTQWLSLTHDQTNAVLQTGKGALTFKTPTAEALRIDATGNVGIGNSNPQGLFEVGNAATPALYIASPTGNVGIGTTGPTAPLHVYTNGSHANLTIQGGGTYDDARLFLAGGAGAQAYFNRNRTTQPYLLNLQTDGSSKWSIGNNGESNENLYFYDAANSNTKVLTIESGADANSLYINSSGNVGIGTTGPTAGLAIGTGTPNRTPASNGLYVTGQSEFDASTYFDSTIWSESQLRIQAGNIYLISDIPINFGTQNQYDLRYNSTSSKLELGDGTSNFLTLNDQGTTADFNFNNNAFWVGNNGNVGIGTTNPLTSLYVTGNAMIGYTSGAPASLANGLAVSGNVGIGTTAPGAMLDINNGGGATNGINFANLGTATRGIDFSNSGLSGATDYLIFHSLSNYWAAAGNMRLASTLRIEEINAGDKQIELYDHQGNNLVDFIAASGNLTMSGIRGNYGFIFDPDGTGDTSVTTASGSDFIVGTNQLYVQGSDGNIGIGATVPQAKLVIQGNVGIGYTGANQAIPVNGLAVFGNVGIGTTTANYNLSVVGTANITGALSVGSLTNTGTFLAANGTASLPAYSFTNLTNAGLWTNGDGLLLTTGGSNTSGLTVTANGNVGIGTTASGAKLELKITGGGGITSDFISILNDGGSADQVSRIIWKNGVDPVNTAAIASAPGAGYNAGDLRFQTATNGTLSTKMTITNTGYVGINHASPGNYLSIAGGLAIGAIGDNTYPTTTAPSGGAIIQGNVGIGTVSPVGLLQVGNSPTPGLVVLSGGNVGIGTTGPSRKLDIFYADTSTSLTEASFIGARVENDSTTDNSFSSLLLRSNTFDSGFAAINNGTTNSGRLSIFIDDTATQDLKEAVSILATSGNVGIGTTGPAARFQINENTSAPFAVQSNGNVGIGTSAPSNILDIYWNTAAETALSFTKGARAYTLGIDGNNIFQIADKSTNKNRLSVNGTTGDVNIGTAGNDSANLYLSGNMGIGYASGTVGARLAVAGNAMIGYSSGAPLSTLANGLAVSGNVGIGTTDPTRKFTIKSGTATTLAANTYDNLLIEADDAPTLRFRDTGVGEAAITGDNGGFRFVSSNDATYGNIVFATGMTSNAEAYGAGTARMTILNGGNIGIGTASPVGKLHLIGAGTTTAPTFMTQNSTSTNFGLAVLDNGNVGIGTTSPASLLQLRTAAASDPSFSLADGDVAHGVTTIAPTDDFLRIVPISSTVGGAYINGLADATGVALQLRGIQSSDPTDSTPSIFLVGAKASGTGVVDLGAAETVFQVANNDDAAALTILGNGNVGIGTTGPGAKLDVAGRIWQTGTGQSVFLGEGAGASDDLTTNQNVFVGYQAGNANTTGHSNTALGYNALAANTTGFRNTAIGFGALDAATAPGEANVAIGWNAMGTGNVTGGYNIALGYYALLNNTTGNSNIALGDDPLRNNTTGTWNIALGSSPLNANTTGISNIAMGRSSMNVNTTGGYNIALGENSLSALKPTSKAITAYADYSGTVAGTVKATSASHGRTTGDSVVISGTTNYDATETITVIDADNFYFTATWVADDGASWWQLAGEGLRNVAIGGLSTAYQLTTGSNNVFLGSNAGYSEITGSSNVFLGYMAGYTETGSNKLYISNSNVQNLIYGDFATGNLSLGGTSAPTAPVLYVGGGGNVGIGTTIPVAKLQLNGTGTTTAPTFMTQNSTSTNFGLAVLDNGNVGIGTTNPLTSLYVTGNAMIGYSSGAPASLANGLAVSGNVGIGTTSPAHILEISGGGQTSVQNGVDGIYVNPNSAHAMVTFENSAGVEGGMMATGGIVYAGSWSNHPLYFRTNNDEKMVITAAGNVGIGTLAPKGLLQVGTSPNPGLIVLSDGNVGIGTTGPIAKFQVNATGTSSFVVDSSGNVGIGTSTTGVPLTVRNLGTTAGTALVVDNEGQVYKTSSSARYKDNIQDLNVDFNKILEANPKSFTYKDTGAKDIGFIAEDFNSLGLKDLVIYDNQGRPDGIKYDRVGLYLLEVVKNQQSIISNLSMNSNGNLSSGVGFDSPEVSTGQLFVSGNVGIGTTDPGAYKLYVNGPGYLNDTGWTYASDSRLKENIESVSSGLDIINALNPITFDYISGGQNRSGFIAQEVQQVLPDLVSQRPDGMLSLRTDEILPYAVKAIQEQQSVIARDSKAISKLNALLTGVTLDKDGSLIVPAIKAGTITLDPSLTVTLNVSEGSLANASSSNELRDSSLNAQNDIGTKIASLEDRLAALEAQLGGSTSNQTGTTSSSEVEPLNTATDSTAIATASATPVIASTSASLSVNSAAISSSSAEIASSSSTLPQDGTIARNDDIMLKLTPPDLLLATASAQLYGRFMNRPYESDATVSGQLTAYNLNVQEGFKSLGKTTLGDTLIAGTLTIDGTLSIENGNEINVMGTLYLQKSALATNIDLFAGKVTIDNNGNITTSGTVLATQFAVKANTTTGTGTIPIGTIDAIIENEYVDENSVILITPHTPLSQTMAVADKIKGGFLIKLARTETKDITFDYLIVGVKP